MTRRLWLFALLLSWASFSAALASPAPHLEWKTLRTGCCAIHYHEGLKKAARRVATRADEAVALAGELLDARPSETIHIVVSDATDSFNGFANVIPYNLVHLFAVPPDGDNAFARTEDWLFTVLLHEVLHVVHLDIAHGLPRFVNLVFGKQWPPNFLLPRWIIEGLATYVESTRTAGGRLRSPRWDAYFRLAALEQDLWSLDDVSNFSRRPPGGHAAYMYGARFLAFLAERHGEAFFAAFAHDYGGRAIPYALKRSFREAAGIDLEAEWRAFQEALREEAERTRERVRARGGPTRKRRLTRIGGTVRSPRFRDDGTLVFVASSPHESAGVYALRGLPFAVPRSEPLAKMSTASEVEPIGEDELVISQSEWWWNHWAFRDLWQLVDGRPPKRLTFAARLRAPSKVPGTRWVLAEERTGKGSAIVRVHLDTGAIEDVVRFGVGTVAYGPRASPDGRHAVYSVLDETGARDLFEVDLETKETKRLTAHPAEDIDPTYTPDGRYVVFSSARDGVFNLYALERATGRILRITDVLGAATSPEVTPDGGAVVFVDEHLEGSDLYAVALDLQNAPLWEADESPIADAGSSLPIVHLEHAPDAEAHLDEPEPYNPLSALWPKSWLPVFRSDALGGPDLGVALAGQDAVDMHRWALQASWGLSTGRPRISAVWNYLDAFFPITLFGEWRTDFSDALRRNQGERELHVEQVVRGAARVTLPIRRFLRGHRFFVGYFRSLHFPETPVTAPPDGPAPRYPPPGNIGSLILEYGYSETDSFRDSVSTERGFSFFLSSRTSNELTLSDLDLYEFTTDVSTFHRVPGLSAHVVALYLSGGIAFGERLRRANYVLGGLGDRDFVRDVIEQRRFGGGHLRGYRPRFDTGDGYMLATLEYRLPIIEVERGVSTLPLYLSRAHAAVFGDLGDAFDGVPDPTRLKVGGGSRCVRSLCSGIGGSFSCGRGSRGGSCPAGWCSLI